MRSYITVLDPLRSSTTADCVVHGVEVRQDSSAPQLRQAILPAAAEVRRAVASYSQ
jgi:hypothetical protein